MAQPVKMRLDEFEDRAAKLGLKTQTAQARAIGVHVSIHNRVLTGVTRELSGPYVIGLLRVFGSEELRKEIDALFHNDLDEQQVAS
ncbi:hypothetical protein ACIBG4_40430 [Nonomuraea sp. NPDC050383]|uniref:hypothetical protein n=1 Tax=Nonomuraea sp. NPDC050383 TaxID=3364362 RepID=UPI003794BF46